MSKTRDKRRRTDLDLFVLALIESGISTPYDLQRAASLSPGATIPVLHRLVEAGYARQGKPGARGRTDHRITAAGKRFLKDGWRAAMQEGPSGDFDADLRLALLALWIGRDRRLAGDFLEKSATRRLASSRALAQRPAYATGPSLGEWYIRLRADSTTAILKAESAVIRSIIEELPKLPAKRP